MLEISFRFWMFFFFLLLERNPEVPLTLFHGETELFVQSIKMSENDEKCCCPLSSFSQSMLLCWQSNNPVCNETENTLLLFENSFLQKNNFKKQNKTPGLLWNIQNTRLKHGTEKWKAVLSFHGYKQKKNNARTVHYLMLLIDWWMPQHQSLLNCFPPNHAMN